MADIKYQSHFPTEIIRLASEGKSRVQICAHWRISKQTLDKWSKDINKPDFMEAYQIAMACSEAYWEDIGQKGVKGILAKFNPSTWMAIMKARFKEDWQDSMTQKIELTNEIKKMSNDELENTIKTLIAQRAANQEKHPDKDETVKH